jgi:uncharacterized protein DUF932
MSHEISRTDEQYARYAVKPAWHALGRVASEEDAESTDRFVGDGIPNVEKVPAWVRGADGQFSAVDGQFHLVRPGYGVVSPSTVTDQYGPVLESTIVSSLRYWVDEGFASWDTMFAFRNGRDTVYTLKLRGVDALRDSGSEYVPYLAVHSPQGTGKIRGIVTAVRVVCANTVRAAFGAGFDWAYHHRGDTDQKVGSIRQTWTRANEQIQRVQQTLGKLESVKVDVKSTLDSILEIIPESSTQATNRRDALLAGANNDKMGTFGSSLLDIYNAVTDYVTRPPSGSRGPADDFASSFDGARGRWEADMLDRILSLA